MEDELVSERQISKYSVVCASVFVDLKTALEGGNGMVTTRVLDHRKSEDLVNWIV
jgi:hypothetical protein